MLSLTGDSGTALGAVTAVQFAPMLLLTLYGGRIADRYDKRRSLMACNLVSGVCALGLAVLDLGGAVRLWQCATNALGRSRWPVSSTGWCSRCASVSRTW